jgi:hypothetical protein
MSEARITNWSLALADHLPQLLAELNADVEELDRAKADKLALIADYTELLSIARRRVATPSVLQLVDPQLRQA